MAEEVTERTIREMVSASGKVFPEVEVKISSDVSGEIVQLLVEEGGFRCGWTIISKN